mmetsp:Transcript_50512/g.120423  ORF Transcript_50512/g.120423 Transcript_50512/m.120423 type:complete len:307 (+) Transcript_50512:92-1012(+)
MLSDPFVGLVQRAARGLGEPLILLGDAALDHLSLHVRQVEGMHQLPDHHFRLLGRSLELVHHLVDVLRLEPGLCKSPGLRRLLHRVGEHFLQVGIYGALMHAHDLPEHLVLALPQPLFGLAPAALHGLALLAIPLRQLHHGRDAPLLLEPQQLLGQLVQRLGDDAALHGLQDAFKGLVPHLVHVPLLLHTGGGLREALRGTELVDEVQALLLALKHEVLVRAATDKALQQKDGRLLLLFFRQDVVLVPGRVWPLQDVPQMELLQPSTRRGVALAGFALVLLQLLLDTLHGRLQCCRHLQLLPDLMA